RVLGQQFIEHGSGDVETADPKLGAGRDILRPQLRLALPGRHGGRGNGWRLVQGQVRCLTADGRQLVEGEQVAGLPAYVEHRGHPFQAAGSTEDRDPAAARGFVDAPTALIPLRTSADAVPENKSFTPDRPDEQEFSTT